MTNKIDMDVFNRAHKMIRVLIWARSITNFGDDWLDRYPGGENPEFPAQMEYRILNNICWRNGNRDTIVKLRRANGEIK